MVIKNQTLQSQLPRIPHERDLRLQSLPCSNLSNFCTSPVFLVNLACGSQTWRNVILEGSRRTLRATEAQKMCPRGTYLTPLDCYNISAQCKCERCPSGEFQAEPTLETECSRCSHCEPKYGQTTLRNCTALRDAKCGCEPGHYKIPDSIPGMNIFTCKPCLRCASLNRKTQQNCSEERDAMCGECQPGFCPSGAERCQPCPRTMAQKYFSTAGPPFRVTRSFIQTSQTPGVETCGKDCQSAAISCGILLLVLPACFVLCWKRSRWTRASFPGGAGSKVLPEQSCLAAPVNLAGHSLTTETEGGFPRGGSLQQGRKLYAVIDAVPVRRWKEFVRGLGLWDREIELVEVEHSQFREQQYEMLKRWCQKEGASAGTIFAVLEEMHLGGCAQELREQLAQLHRPLRSP
ncbi:tumor necrosis factor receptor superfamily member 25 isoform X1 [Sceloporus undulatus]|uniref:tumor necrosis factor receptor superfamily member 25 isoform X1 n=1 Tax=Sceloporus undulatus TaxID=8520 RepID=UPI001C4AA491|nr:tumor necrosis factor receptor superfamily member 25 isoform X1 [Sceloporus undulatus]